MNLSDRGVLSLVLWFRVQYVRHTFVLFDILSYTLCFTLRLEISSRFSYSINIFHEYFTFCLCFCDIFCDLLTFHSLIIRFVFCLCRIFRDLLTFHSLIVRFVFVFALFYREFSIYGDVS